MYYTKIRLPERAWGHDLIKFKIPVLIFLYTV